MDTAFLFNPNLGAQELLESLLQEFEIKCESPSPRAVINALNEFLLEKRRQGRRVLMILDEAQGLEAATLEQVRLLSNLETERDKLLQILMLGQPELDEMLESPALRQLRQRIGVRWRLSPLTREEVGEYVAHRLRVAAGGDRNLFSPAALRAIHARSGGIPRRINLLCDRALLAAYGRGLPQVTRAIVSEAALELDGQLRRRSWRRGTRRLVATVIGALALAAVFIAAGGVEWTSAQWTALRDAPPLAEVSAAPPRSAPLASHRDTGAEAPIALAASTAAAPVVEVAPVDPFDAALGALAPSDSLWRAAEGILRAWQLEPTPDQLGPDLATVLERTRGLGLRVLSKEGLSFAALRQLGHPALLRLDSGHVVGLAAVRGDAVEVIGLENASLWIPSAQLDAHWSGEAHVLWRDTESLPPVLSPTGRGEGVRWLQTALIELGYLAGDPSGYFDPGTERALRAFQEDYSLGADGRVGPMTKMALYRSLPRYEIPRLEGGAR